MIFLNFKNCPSLSFDDMGLLCSVAQYVSIDGRMLKSQNTDFENIDVSGLSMGVYFVKIRLQEGSVFTEKNINSKKCNKGLGQSFYACAPF